MAYIVDTQILLWLDNSQAKLPPKISELLFKSNQIFFSKVSVWEVAIKTKINKLHISDGLEEFVNKFQNDYGFKLLPISLQHIYQTKDLELHHRDPFDRLLIAQAIVENFSVISSDDMFDAYPIKRIW